ncbi:ubiquitin-like domain-containing protein [Halobacillus salinarum]|uniref:Ubiquitin-like domain-containing protein n=1 Tax=Halobacillus salinarum TaxID=2932257 RepID=A0ABY4EM04_9BACI|nr:G5 and 3D domain-containing protein [Halobacillus salinarum]UOQ44684.1 ubiquitin-like domain-containing protein [Halobacillus salinarum]
MKFMNKLKSGFGFKLGLAFVISVLSIAFIGTVTYEATKASVRVTQDGKTQLIRTHANTVEQLLTELDITVDPHDQLSHKLTAPITYGMAVNYQSSKAINLAIDHQKAQKVYTTASTVGGFLKEQEVEVADRDEISHEQAASVKDGMDIQVNHAREVAINDGGEKKKVWTTASTVADFLDSQDIKLNKLDELKPGKNAALADHPDVTITRIEKVTDIVEDDQPYTVVTKKDHSIPKGEERVLSSGEKGKVTKKYEVIIKNGKETSRKLIDKKINKKSEKRVVAIGTKESAPKNTNRTVATASTNQSSSSSNKITQTASRGNTSSSKTLYMHATKYTANCSGCSGITATGINLKANPGMKVVAVDPSVIPLGSRVWVEGYGYAVAGDTGGAIQGNRIDLFVSSRGEALSYGSRNVKVKILGK